ncbi:MAG: alpha/beta fold hydrolase [Actinomycetota bacterium]|nr:alpha/beta fold hydrolase [Actinomycetota bacterium]
MEEPRRAAGLAYREVAPADGEPRGTVLLVHGWPESSWMWRGVMGPLAEARWHAVAPDLAGFGDSAPDPPSTWERQVAALDRLHGELDLGPVALVVHDWGGLIGLRWACDHGEAVRALCISDTGFFSDGQWHGLAQTLRTDGEGERLLESLDRDGFGALLRQAIPGIDDRALDEYWKGFADDERRRGTLELYRSGDFAKLAPYDGRLAELAVPTLALWGADDPFAPVGGAHRFADRIPGAELVVLDGVGHFAPEQAPERYAAALVDFLGRTAS